MDIFLQYKLSNDINKLLIDDPRSRIFAVGISQVFTIGYSDTVD